MAMLRAASMRTSRHSTASQDTVPGLVAGSVFLPKSSSVTHQVSVRARASRELQLPPGQITVVMRKVARLPAARRLIRGPVDEFTAEDAIELFRAIGSKDGQLHVDVLIFVLQDLFNCPEQQLMPLRQSLEGRAHYGFVAAEQLPAAASAGPGRKVFDKLHAHSKRVYRALDRNLLVERISMAVDTDESLSTLPLTLLYMVVFMALIVLHLRIWERQQLERSLVYALEGASRDLSGPYLHRHVSDAESFLLWLEQSGLPAILSGPGGIPGPGGRTAVSHRFLGDVRLRQQSLDGQVRSVWLLHSDTARAHLQGHPGDFTAAAVAACRELRRQAWADRRSEHLDLAFQTYSEQPRIFALAQVHARLGVVGHVGTTVSATALHQDQYAGAGVYVADVAFVLLLIVSIVREGRKMFVVGFAGLREYWTPWNAIDCFSIVAGIVNCGLWIACCTALQTEMLREVTEGHQHSRGLIPLELAQLNAVRDSLELASARFFVLHLVVAVNAFSIVVRFFKAFEANPRLSMVAESFQRTYLDLVHFAVVFSVIFMCMTLIAHVLFGTDLRQFCTIWSSFRSGGTVLLGDLGWYVALKDSGDTLPSGMPFRVLALWFVIYVLLVTIVLLNMLLAIIVDCYSAAEKSISTATPTLWGQAVEYAQQARKTRGFIPLRRLRLQLEQSRHPAHQEQMVSRGSLKDSFVGMRDQQAAWLMRWLEEQAAAEAPLGADGEQRAALTKGVLQDLKREIEALTPATAELGARLDALEKHLQTMEPQWQAAFEAPILEFAACGPEAGMGCFWPGRGRGR